MNNIVDVSIINVANIKGSNSKNNNSKKTSFMKLINHEGPDHKDKPVNIDVKAHSLEKHFDAESKNALAEKENKNLLELFNHELAKTEVQASSREGALAKAELHEQKWYSIGKLSYIDIQKREMMESNYGNQNLYKDSSAYTELDVTDNFSPLQVSKSHSDALNSRVIKRNEVVASSKDKIKSNLNTPLQVPHEIEKRKISLLKNNDENMVVVRDYLTDKGSLSNYIEQLFTIAKIVVSKITINGKEIK